MSRRLLIAGIIVGVLVSAAAGWWFGYRPYSEKRQVIGAISRYNVAVTDAYANLDESRLGSVAGPEEVTRLTTYMLGLDGTGTLLESELLDMDVTDYRAESPTYTVTTDERWRVAERDRESGQLRGSAQRWRHVMRYTVVRTDKGVVVYRTDLIKQTQEESE